jgi:hypothetical protein
VPEDRPRIGIARPCTVAHEAVAHHTGHDEEQARGQHQEIGEDCGNGAGFRRLRVEDRDQALHLNAACAQPRPHPGHEPVTIHDVTMASGFRRQSRDSL